MFDSSDSPDSIGLEEAAENIKSEIRKNITEIAYGLWFTDMAVLKMTDLVIFLSVNTEMQQKTIESKYMYLVRQAVKDLYNSDVCVVVYNSQYAEVTKEQIDADERRILLSGELSGGVTETAENYNIFSLRKFEGGTTDVNSGNTEDEVPEFTLQSGGQYDISDEVAHKFRSEYTFDNFIVGSTNRLTYVACTVVAQSPASKYNPLFIHGPSGLGKTHLLYAIANDCAKRYKNSRVIYVKGEEFTNQLIESIADNNPGLFREKYRSCDMLLIDDIQFISGKFSTQEELFHTFNALYEAGKQIVFTSDRPPRDIQPLENRLTSRFESGLITEVEPPDLELRIAILKRKAKDMDVKISNEVLLYLAENVTSNIRQIEGAIKKLNAYSYIEGSDGVTLELAKSSIADVLSGNEPVSVTVDKALNAASKKFNVSIEELKSRKRTKEIAFARHVAIYIMRRVTDMSLVAIGRVFNRDHSTILSAIDVIENEIKVNKELELKIEETINLIK